MSDFPLVTTQWVSEHLAAPDVRVADASWYLDPNRNGRAEYEKAHIPGAVFFDIEALSDPNTSLPHMLADPVRFASGIRKLGIGNGNTVVVYDGAGMFSAARAWWMMRAMGHKEVFVLDGGLPKWRREGRALEDLPPAQRFRHFLPRPQPALVRNFDATKDFAQSCASQILDARSASRFTGEEKDPRPGVKPGHIPGSTHIHYASLIAPDGTMKSRGELAAIFTAKGVDLQKPIVTSCGSGVTAAIIALALEIVGAKDVGLYDGSWAEWGSRDDAPIAVGQEQTA